MQFFVLFLLILTSLAQAQDTDVASVQKVVNDTLASKWYERIQLRGYAQFRYNRLFETNKKVTCSNCDSSIGDRQGFFLRRARLTFFGDVTDKVFVYIQPDYASSATASSGGASGTQQNYFQIRDAYFDYHLSQNREWRVRLGVSKVPFGYDNLQSSSQRANLDRSDALNNAAPNERDTGIFLMYAPVEIRKRFKELSSAALKGSGDYGMVSVGAYNGQTLNRSERNNDLHRVVRVTYPWKLASGQFIEGSLQAYEGKFNTIDATSPAPASPGEDYYDARQAASFILYPQPFGFQAEYNVGMGPEFNAGKNAVTTRNLKGGYAQINYAYNHDKDRYFPFLRYQEYEGGKKLLNSQQYNVVREWEVGTEWQPNPAMELTAAYTISDRLTQSSSSNRSHLKGNFLRLQAQFNY